MASTYILYSKTIDKYYIGSCLEINERLELHSLWFYYKSYTSKAKDWVLFFEIDGLTQNQALQIEKHIKKMKSRIYFQNLKKHVEISQKLKIRFQ